MRKEIYLLFVLALFSYLFPAKAQEVIIHIYADESSETNLTLRYFQRQNCDVIFHDLNSSWDNFSKIVETLLTCGIRIEEPNDCVTCLLAHLTWDEFLRNYASPMIGYFHERKLTAITLGIEDVQILQKALSLKNDHVDIFTRKGEYTLRNESVRVMLEEMFQEPSKQEISASNVIWPLALLALADSINPCTFAFFTALLLITMHLYGKARTALNGFLFLIAIFISYYLLGCGLIFFFAKIPYVEKIIALVGIVIGGRSIYYGLKPKFKSLLPNFFRKITENCFNKSYGSPILSFLLGIVVSFTLLPCSSSPYIVSLTLMSGTANSFPRYLALLIYNAIFVLPLFIILFSILLFQRYATKKMKMLRTKRLNAMELIQGLLLLVISVYIFSFL